MKKKLLIGIITALFLIGLIGSVNASPTQWLASEGGNDHWYEVVTFGNGITWAAANLEAESSVYLNMTGYLASVTTDDENTFISDLFGFTDWVYNNLNGFMGPWLGGHQLDDKEWTWTSGEEWGYTNWETNQPSNQPEQDYLHYYISLGEAGNPFGESATWNDLGTDQEGVYGYVVEYSTAAPVPIAGSFLLLCSGLIGMVGINKNKLFKS